jgi:hypothetical protein
MFSGRLRERLGWIKRQPSWTVTFCIGRPEALLPATRLARAIQEHFPRTMVVFVQDDAWDRSHGFETVAHPWNWAWASTLKRLRTRMVVLAGVGQELGAAVAKATHRRGASLVLVASREVERSPASGPVQSLDAVIDVDDGSPGEAALAKLVVLMRRSRRNAFAKRGDLPWRTRLIRLMRCTPLSAVLQAKFHEFGSIAEVRAALGHPRVILCLGNGPSSEHADLGRIHYDRLFRVNMRWASRGLLTAPDLVFTWMPQTVDALRPSVGFAFGGVQSEEKILSGCLFSRRRFRYLTAERLGLFDYSSAGELRPTNGALMLALAVACEPEELVVAGIDLYRHPSGAYPGDPGTENAYAVAHTSDLDLAVIVAALRRYRGRLTILSEALRDVIESNDDVPAAAAR